VLEVIYGRIFTLLRMVQWIDITYAVARRGRYPIGFAFINVFDRRAFALPDTIV
jgi:hypothetical protein